MKRKRADRDPSTTAVVMRVVMCLAHLRCPREGCEVDCFQAPRAAWWCTALAAGTLCFLFRCSASVLVQRPMREAGVFSRVGTGTLTPGAECACGDAVMLLGTWRKHQIVIFVVPDNHGGSDTQQWLTPLTWNSMAVPCSAPPLPNRRSSSLWGPTQSSRFPITDVHRNDQWSRHWGDRAASTCLAGFRGILYIQSVTR